MKNRMQDLDFEQNVAFDKVQEYEFTRRAAQRFRQVVSLDSFEDEDADVIFHYLYKEMELVSFGDHLKIRRDYRNHCHDHPLRTVS